MTNIKISVIVIHRIIILNINNVFKTKLKSIMINLCFVLFLVCLYVFVYECLLQNNMRMYTSINIHMSKVHYGNAVRFSQALLGYLITAHHWYASLR